MSMGATCVKRQQDKDKEQRIPKLPKYDEFALELIYGDNISLAAMESEGETITKNLKDALLIVGDNSERDEPLINLHTVIAQKGGWQKVMFYVVQEVPFNNPFGPQLIKVLSDKGPVPTAESMRILFTVFHVSGERASYEFGDVQTDYNMCILLGCLAHKIPATTEYAPLKQKILDFFFVLLKNRTNGYFILGALFGLQKFSMVIKNKQLVRQLLHDNQLVEVIEYEIKEDDNDYVDTQLKFVTEWALDHVYPVDGRRLSCDGYELMGPNVVLNIYDTTDHVKISSDGLMARCDEFSFESARGSFRADEGCWYYEVTLITDGVMQIGWATQSCVFRNRDGIGIGDDRFSVGYDGCRSLVWHKNTKERSADEDKWQPGDVIGCLLDIDKKEAVFTRNGHIVARHTEIFQSNRHGFYAAVSLLTFQQVDFNFGLTPFIFPPTDREFSCFQDYVEQVKKQNPIRPERQPEGPDNEVCCICFDQKGIIQLLPCEHWGFCASCTSQMESCPLCRSSFKSLNIKRSDTGNDDAAAIALAAELRYIAALDEELRIVIASTSGDLEMESN